MVQAVLEDRKCITRREVKVKTALSWIESNMFTPEYVALPENNLCPYGKIGDILWVRETFTILEYHQPIGLTVRFEDGESKTAILTKEEWDKFSNWKIKIGKRTSLFLFKSLSRIRLEIIDIRIERLQDITEADAIKEGIDLNKISGDWECTPVQVFEELWISINGKESWERNPWVWVIEFKRL